MGSRFFAVNSPSLCHRSLLPRSGTGRNRNLLRQLPVTSVTRRETRKIHMDAAALSDSNSSVNHNAGGADEAAAGGEDSVVQYVVLRRDLVDSWPMGSIVTQGCHASVAAIWAHRDDPHTLQYCSPELIDSMHKVTLEVKGETQLRNLSEKLTGGGIDHKLWIEQPENSPTCLATKPYPKGIVSPYFRKLKLCK